MIARDKAIIMVAKYEKLGIDFEIAKQCALLECDAVIELVKGTSLFPVMFNYHYDVKQHIVNL